MEDRQFPYYIEDWILWAGNVVDDQGKPVDYYQPFTASIRLANYDISFIKHGCKNIVNGIGFTDRQLVTAVKIITKYRRQIAKHLDISLDYLLESPPQRLSTRKVDRQFVVSKSTEGYIVQFPYDKSMVNDMHSYRRLSCGGFEWNNNDRKRYIVPYELNLSLLYKFIKKYKNCNWQLDTEVKEQFAIVQHSYDNIYKHVPYIDLEDGQLFVYNSNDYLNQALKEFDLTQPMSRVVFFADNYGLRVGPNLTNCIKEQYNSIHKVLLASQSMIFDKASRLQTDLSISDLEYFMQSVQADHWVVVTFGVDTGKENKLVSALQQTSVPGKQSYYQYRDKKKKSVHDFLASDLKSQSVVLFVDNTHALAQLSAELPNSLLKIVYLYSHDTGKKIENM